MKNFKGIIAASLAATLLVSGIAVIAANTEKAEKPYSRQKVELTEEQKAEMKEKALANAKDRLAKQLEEGKITQEQYDEQLAKIESGDFNFDKAPHGNFGKGRGNDFRKKELTEEEKAEMKEKNLANAKDRLAKQLEEGKITQEQYDEQLAKIESGDFNFDKAPHGNFGKGRGNDFRKKELTEEEKAEMKEKALSNAKDRLAKQLEEGKITQEQYDEQLAKIESGDFNFDKAPHGNFGKGRGNDFKNFRDKKANTSGTTATE